jgi:DNA-binding transcriptional MerR regulator
MPTLLSIGDFSRMTFLSVKALRHYHDVGLLLPAEIDTASGYRRYDVTQVPRAQVIRRLRELGMPLEAVRVVIEAPDVRARNAAISTHLRRMEGDLERTRTAVTSLRMLLDEDAPPAIPIEFRVVGPMQALAVRGQVPNAEMFEWLDVAFAELRPEIEHSGARRAGPDAALFSSALLEDEHGEIVALIPVEAGARPAGRIEGVLLPAVEYAVAVHVGTVEDIDRSYAALGTVVAGRAIGVQGPIREDYLIGPHDTPDERQHRTEISWPVFHTTPAT